MDLFSKLSHQHIILSHTYTHPPYTTPPTHPTPHTRAHTHMRIHKMGKVKEKNLGKLVDFLHKLNLNSNDNGITATGADHG